MVNETQSRDLRVALELLKIEIAELKSALDSHPNEVTIECLDKIINLQHKSIELQKLLLGTTELEARLICDAACVFCNKAIKEISLIGCASTSDKAKRKKLKTKKCKIHKLFDSFYNLFY